MCKHCENNEGTKRSEAHKHDACGCGKCVAHECGSVGHCHGEEGCSCGDDKCEGGCCGVGCEHCARGAAPIDLDHVEEEADEESEGGHKILRILVAAIFFVAALVLNHAYGVTGVPYLGLVAAAYFVAGYDVVASAVTNLFRGRVFDENFLMTVASVAAFCIGEYLEAVAVMGLYQIGEYCQDKAVGKSRRSIASLMDVRPDRATVIRSGKLVEVAAEEVLVGEVIVVKAGEKVPLDGVVREGASSLDTSALTGESALRTIEVGGTVLSGCINKDRVLKVEVTKAFKESTASKIVEMVQHAAARKAPSEKFITRFARYYTPIVVILAVLLAVAVPLVTGDAWGKWIENACVFLVISCPCALVISVPLTFFAGIGAASRNGVLFKGGASIETLCKLDTVVFDKTGTLTRGAFSVTEVMAADGVEEAELIEAAAAAELLSNHPIAKSILNEAKKRGLSIPEKEACKAFTEVPGRGTSVSYGVSTILAGNTKYMEERGIDVSLLKAPTDEVGTLVHVCRDDAYLGCVVIADTLKPDTADALKALRALGIRKSAMLTGDNAKTAQAIAAKIAIDEVRAELLPGDKVEAFEQIVETVPAQGKTAFVGDGINDAPVLARADIGVAMGALGSDAAIEAADVVLMTDELSKLVDGIKIARNTHAIVLQNIVFALAVKVAFLVLGALGQVGLWFAVFADVGVMLIAVANAMRAMKHVSVARAKDGANAP